MSSLQATINVCILALLHIISRTMVHCVRPVPTETMRMAETLYIEGRLNIASHPEQYMRDLFANFGDLRPSSPLVIMLSDMGLLPERYTVRPQLLPTKCW